MKIAFYNAPTKLFNRLVRWWDNSVYSHCEVVLEEPNEDGLSLCGSSSFLDGGVRTKLIDLNSGKWDVIDLGSLPEMEADAKQWFIDHDGEGYDVLGIVGFIFRIIPHDKTRWFCSEVVATILRFVDAWRFDPATIAAVTKGEKWS